MDQDEADSHGEISQGAGKGWLKPLSVSIAQLNQVTATICNLSPSQASALKSKTSRCQRVDFGIPQAQPPLSNLQLQSSAWGSNTSIPDLIRRQSERQKSRQLKERPESAKVRRQTRPPSGRKPRPHSAKDSAHHEAAKPPKSSTFNYVQGAHFILTDRPPDGLRYHGNMGHVAPPDGSSEKIARNIDDVLDAVAWTQYQDDGIPPPPCASPALTDMMDQNESSGDLDLGEVILEASDSRSSMSDRGPAPLLRRPTAEPIKLSLPQAALEIDTDVEDELVLSDTEGCHGNNSFDNEDELPPKENVQLRNKSLDADTNSWASPKLNRTKNNSKKGSRVTFSGVTFADINDSQDVSSKERISAVPKVVTKNKAKVSVISVAYIEDGEVNDASSDVTPVPVMEKSIPHKALKKRKIFAQKKEIESQMSLLSLSDDEGKKADPPETLETKYTSQNSNQNYYELSKKIDTEDSSKSKTIKTLEFGDSGIAETKTVERIDSPPPQSKPPYQAPRPQSGRPSSGLKSGSMANSSASNLTEKRDKFRRGISHDSGASLRPSSGKRLFNHKSFDDTKLRVESSNPQTQGKGVALENMIAPIIMTPPVEEKLFEKRNPIPSGPPQNDAKKLTVDKSEDVKAKLNLLRVASAPPMSMQRHLSIDHGKPRPKSAAVPNKNDEGLGQLSVLNMERPSCRGNHPSQSRPVPSQSRRGKKEEPKKVIEIWTRREDTEIETEGIKHCKQVQAKMVENGIPIALETLKRALLPPTEYATKPGYQTNTIDKRTALPSYNSGLLSKPSTWFPAEYKRLLKAKRLVREAKAALDAQRREQERKERIMYLDTTAVPEPTPAPTPVVPEEVTKKKKRKKRSRSASSQRSRPSSSRPNSGKYDR